VCVQAWLAPELRVGLAGVDVVVDLVGAQGGEEVSAEILRAANLEATRELATAAVGRVNRFVLVSSVRVYGVGHLNPITEETPLRPNTEYGRMKVAAEQAVRRILGSATVVLRLSEVYGPGDRRSMVFKMLELLRRGIQVWIGSGDNFLHPCYLDDGVRAIELATTGAASGCFLVAGPEPVTMRALLETAAGLLGLTTPRFFVPTSLALALARLGGVARAAAIPFPLTPSQVYTLCDHRSYDLTRSRAALGYAPVTGIRDGVRRMLAP
jgi:nucleoside-diphosphate-sugar epimerase